MTALTRVALLVLGLGLGLGFACAHEPGVYANPERQLIYDDAKSSGDCGRACCDYVGSERGLSGTWNSRTRTCSWQSEGGFQLACVNWCKRETGNDQ
jgi:hypothetical protein